MGLFRSSKKVASKVVDVRVDRWMSWDYLADTTDRIKSMVVSIAVPQKSTYAETFEEAMQRLGLTEEDLAHRKKEYTQLFYFFLVLFGTVVLYALYMGFNGHLIASLISFCLSLYCLTQAFRFHFWLFQIKNRKLGCSIKEWINSKAYDAPPTSTSVVVKRDPSMSTVSRNEKEKGQ